MSYVKLAPIVSESITSLVPLSDDGSVVYKLFIPGEVYEVTDYGLNYLKTQPLTLSKEDSRLREAFDLNLSYKKINKGCTPCQKRKKLDPEAFIRYVFSMFVEVDKEGNLLAHETQGEMYD